MLHAVRKIGGERQKNTELNQQLHVLEQTLRVENRSGAPGLTPPSRGSPQCPSLPGRPHPAKAATIPCLRARVTLGRQPGKHFGSSTCALDPRETPDNEVLAIVLKTNQDQVLGALQAVSASSSGATLPILANVLIRKTGSQIEFTTSDLEIQVRTTVELGG